ncbi:hypothetical protein LguiA_025302 [Lonicera macranthoides]
MANIQTNSHKAPLYLNHTQMLFEALPSHIHPHTIHFFHFHTHNHNHNHNQTKDTHNHDWYMYIPLFFHHGLSPLLDPQNHHHYGCRCHFHL